MAEPSCYGKLWDPNNAECAGGRDPSYTDPSTGSHIRDRCMFFNSCGARVQAQKQALRTDLIPVTNLSRPAAPAVISSSPTPSTDPAMRTMLEQMRLLQQQMQQMQQGAYRPGYQGVVVRPDQGYHPYQQMMPVNYNVPAYLTVPEPLHPEESVGRALGREIARSAFKSIGHTIAAFFDHNPLGKPRP